MEQIIPEEFVESEDCEKLAKCLGFKIDSFEPIEAINTRQKCQNCERKRMYFCYDCRIFMQQVANLVPQIQLPVRIDLIKHWLERNSKSTAVHCALMSPRETRIFDSFDEVPDYSNSVNTVVVYPSSDALSIDEYVQKNGPIQRFIFLDATWWTVGRLRNLQQLRALPNVALKSYKTYYWRPQKGYSDEFLATIEAIYYAVRENFDATQVYLKKFQECKSNTVDGTGDNKVIIQKSEEKAKKMENSKILDSYNGQFDNLLFWFFYFRSKVQPEKRRNNR